MKTITLSLTLAVLALAAWRPALAAEALSADETRRLQDLGAKAFSIRWHGRVVGASERGVRAITDRETTLTARPDFLGYIVHSKPAIEAKGAKPFGGSDGALRDRGLKMLAAAGAERAEILEARVLQQYTQAGQHDPRAGRTVLGKPTKDRRTLLVTRKVAEVPVISSHLRLDLDRAGAIALMELSWPVIPPHVIEEAKRFREAATRDFKAPPMEGAVVESAEAVILHSPVASFHDDVAAAIRVIYRPEREGVGKKAVRYVDAEGRDIAMPRETDPLREERLQRKG